MCSFLEYMLWRLKKKDRWRKTHIVIPSVPLPPPSHLPALVTLKLFTHMHLHFNTPLCASTGTIHYGGDWWGGGDGGAEAPSVQPRADFCLNASPHEWKHSWNACGLVRYACPWPDFNNSDSVFILQKHASNNLSTSILPFITCIKMIDDFFWGLCD